MKRHRAEDCDRLALGTVRSLVQPGDEVAALGDGTTLALRWGVARGCYGSQPGRTLLLVCPGCSRSCRVLWQPPGQRWGCWGCWPLTHRSHRRPGARCGRPKPLRWQIDRIQSEQRRCAALLGLQQWPPDRLFWGAVDLWLAPRRAGAPRISHHRQLALIQRLDALETLRILTFLLDLKALSASQGLPAKDPPTGMGERAAAAVRSTDWAMRRGPRDARTLRSTAGLSDCGRVKLADPVVLALANQRATDNLPGIDRWNHDPSRTRRSPHREGQRRRAPLVPFDRQCSGDNLERDGAPMRGH